MHKGDKQVKFIVFGDIITMEKIIKGWIAKDGDELERVCFFNTVPVRGKGIFQKKQWICREAGWYFYLPKHLFKEMKWEEEPVKVSITIKDES